ncbi:hypothetical protein [Kitasatospora sp. GAS204B]|uniref:hypothetical protein n=1 Tax=unclassified Kitasatospora TaxID=2633591 RepID=UPI0024730323|nr:hypothetical protein [Kitasatospora sp. GAS204B]MDH6116958.1 hypothetical protein [Kitasatospora sp. GAS204B]
MTTTGQDKTVGVPGASRPSELEKLGDLAEEKRPEAPEESEGAADLFRALGKLIRFFREKRGMTQREFGVAIFLHLATTHR